MRHCVTFPRRSDHRAHDDSPAPICGPVFFAGRQAPRIAFAFLASNPGRGIRLLRCRHRRGLEREDAFDQLRTERPVRIQNDSSATAGLVDASETLPAQVRDGLPSPWPLRPIHRQLDRGSVDRGDDADRERRSERILQGAVHAPLSGGVELQARPASWNATASALSPRRRRGPCQLRPRASGAQTCASSPSNHRSTSRRRYRT